MKLKIKFLAQCGIETVQEYFVQPKQYAHIRGTKKVEALFWRGVERVILTSNYGVDCCVEEGSSGEDVLKVSWLMCRLDVARALAEIQTVPVTRLPLASFRRVFYLDERDPANLSVSSFTLLSSMPSRSLKRKLLLVGNRTRVLHICSAPP